MRQFHPQLFGRYLLVERLASGGMAEVYRAKMFSIDGFEKILAIKRILPNMAEDRQFVGMLTDEAKLSTHLSHTSIVQVYDFGKIGADYFIAMEFIFGKNLHEVLNRFQTFNKTFPEEISVYIISEVSRGLDYAHSKSGPDGKPLGIIHRDISPPNILISYEGEVKIVDFGIAKAALNRGQTVAGVIKGKIAYMSPEQARGEDLDNRSDVYSLGLTFYEMLTGEKLVGGDSQLEILRKIQNTKFAEKDFDESISPVIRKVLAKSLAFEREDRYGTAGMMHADLSRYLNSTYPDFTSRALKTSMQQSFTQEIKIGKEKAAKEAESAEGITKKWKEEQQKLLSENRLRQIPDKKKPFRREVEEKIYPTKVGYFAEQSPRRRAYSVVLPLLALFLIVGGIWYFTRSPDTAMEAGEKISPPPEQASPAQLGKILVQSVPDGARITLDNAETHLKTPAILDKLPIGKTVVLTLKKPDFQDWSQAIVVTGEGPIEINSSLKPIPKGVLVLSTSPPGATIFLDNQEVGKKTPAVLEDLALNTPYRLRLQLDRYTPLEETFSLSDDTPLEIERELTSTYPRKTSSSPKLSSNGSHSSSSGGTVDSKKQGGAAGTMGRGFKKAGSSIKGFFTGKKKSEEKQE